MWKREVKKFNVRVMWCEKRLDQLIIPLKGGLEPIVWETGKGKKTNSLLDLLWRNAARSMLGFWSSELSSVLFIATSWTPFRISWHACILTTNSVSFCSYSVAYKENFPRYRNLACTYCSFHLFDYITHFLLVSAFCWEVSCHFYWGFLVHDEFLLSCSFKIFFLLLNIWSW